MYCSSPTCSRWAYMALEMELLSGNRLSRQGHHRYDESHIAALLQIKFAKAMGFTLKDMRDKLAGWQTGQLSDADKRAILTAQLQKVDEAAAEIEQVRAYLQTKIARLDCEVDAMSCEPTTLPG